MKKKLWQEVQEMAGELQQFSNDAYPFGIFVPHACSLRTYNKAPKKVFYYGQDTHGWMGAKNECGSFRGMLDLFARNQWQEYRRQNSWPHSPADIFTLQDGDRNAFWNKVSFWSFVYKFHLFHVYGKWFESIDDVPNELLRKITEVGYGNLNAVELWRSLYNEGRTDTLVKEKYNQVKVSSRRIDKLRFVLEEFDPDEIVIMTWGWNDGRKATFFEGLVPEYYRPKETKSGRWNYYTFKGHKTKMICLDHPSSFKYRKFNFGQMIKQTSNLLDAWPTKKYKERKS